MTHGHKIRGDWREGGTGRTGRKGEKNGTTVVASSIKYSLKNK